MARQSPAESTHALEHAAGPPVPLNRLVPGAQQTRIGFLLVPGFTHIGFVSAIEPLRMANMVAGRPDYAALSVTVDGEAVASSNGVRTIPDYSVDDLPPVDAVFVCGANPIHYPRERRLRNWLRGLSGRGTMLGGIDTGADLLARAGLLDGYRCTIHWQNMREFIDRFPRTIVSSQVFEIDRDRCTSSGGTTSMDMMLEFIATRPGGGDVAPAVADLLVHERIRSARDRQRVPLRQRLGSGQSRLSAAVALMENNIEEPLRLPEVAEHAGISIRQLERLFHEHLDCTPAAYYMELRLLRAREHLLRSDLPVAEVAALCGFRTTAHLTRRYQRFFGVPPSEDRRRLRRMATRVAAV